MRLLIAALITALTTSTLSLPVQAATKAQIEAFVNRLKSGDLDANVLLYPNADRRVAFAHTNAWMPTRPLYPSASPYTLETDIDDSLSSVTYTVDSETFTVADLLSREPLMGMAVVDGDTIKLEHYAADHGPESVWISFSVTKSFTSTLIGAAIKDGFIGSVDDKVEDYLPRLKGSDYGRVTLKNILQMSSGIAWNEDYTDPESDVSVAGTLQGVALTVYLCKLPQ